jgi:hypothetical protein
VCVDRAATAGAMHSITIRLIPSAVARESTKQFDRTQLKALAYTQYDIMALPVSECVFARRASVFYQTHTLRDSDGKGGNILLGCK